MNDTGKNHQKTWKISVPLEKHTEAPDENTYLPVKPGKSPMIFSVSTSPYSWFFAMELMTLGAYLLFYCYFIRILFIFHDIPFIYPFISPLKNTILLGKNQARKSQWAWHNNTVKELDVFENQLSAEDPCDASDGCAHWWICLGYGGLWWEIPLLLYHYTPPYPNHSIIIWGMIFHYNRDTSKITWWLEWDDTVWPFLSIS